MPRMSARAHDIRKRERNKLGKYTSFLTSIFIITYIMLGKVHFISLQTVQTVLYHVVAGEKRRKENSYKK